MLGKVLGAAVFKSGGFWARNPRLPISVDISNPAAYRTVAQALSPLKALRPAVEREIGG